MSLDILWTKPQIGGLTLKNRIIRSATFEAMAAQDGTPTTRLTNLYTTFAKNDVGLIISGGVYTEPQGIGHKTQLGLMNDKQQEAMGTMIEEIHKAHGLIALQLNHAGLETRSKLNGGFKPEGPSKTSERNDSMSKDTIMRIVESFIDTAKRAHAIGADGIQLHAAHGYLLGEFLSPIWNKRSDEFGGDVKGRFEIVRLICEGIRSSIPTSFPLFLKINGHDVEKGGVTVESAIETALLAEKCGVDALEISSGSGRKPYSMLGEIDFDYIFKDQSKREKMKQRLSDIHFKPAFNLDYAKEIKKNTKLPIITVGGFRTAQEMADAISSRKTDMVSLSRPFIRDPSVVRRLREGVPASTCISCNRCFFEAMAEKPVKCTQPY